MNTIFCTETFTFKTKLTLRAVAVLLLGLVVAGCGSGDQPANQTSTQSPQPSGGKKIAIKGSNTVGEELAPRLIAEYKKDHPQAVFDLETKGSGSGFWGIIAGVCDIAAASRSPIKDEQQQAEVRGIQFNDNIIGSYTVAVVVGANNPVTNLTREQVRDIFTGAVQNWKEVGGPDASIHLYARDPISGTYLGFRELALEDKAYSTNITTFTNYAGIAQAVAKDPNGIGYASFDLADKNGVKGVVIAGVPANISSVKDGKYPFARALHLFTNKGSESEPARDFVQFVQSSRGQEIVQQMGFVPKP